MTDMADKTSESNGHDARHVVHVAIYEHPHGNDVRVFRNQDDAWNWRTRIAQEWWRHAFDDEPPSEEVIGSEYFDRMVEKDGAEYFSVVPCEFEIGDPDPADLMNAHGGTWGEDPHHPVSSWMYEVANGDTRNGYWTWVAARVESHAGDPEPSDHP